MRTHQFHEQRLEKQEIRNGILMSSVSFQLWPLGFSQHQCFWGLSLGISGLWQNKRCLPVCMFQDWSHVYLHNSAGRRDKDSV